MSLLFGLGIAVRWLRRRKPVASAP
ncbi:MAG: hypothetical protein CMM01_24255 [Rhodopirellula sp.]|nr:hypothetical protein [Rhodopirellula sp.]